MPAHKSKILREIFWRSLEYECKVKGQLWYYCEDALNVILPNVRSKWFISDLGHTSCMDIIYRKKEDFKSWGIYSGTLIQLIVHQFHWWWQVLYLLCFKRYLPELLKTSGNNYYFVCVFEQQREHFGQNRNCCKTRENMAIAFQGIW